MAAAAMSVLALAPLSRAAEDPARGDVSLGPEDARLRGALEFEAELLRRSGGEWVIVSLGPRDPATAPAVAPPPLSADDSSGVQAALAEYQSAMESRDTGRLGRVWIMNPAEQAQVKRFFESTESFLLRLGAPKIVVAGDHALARFDQALVVSKQARVLRTFRPSGWRSLVARDAVGNWTLEDVLDGS